MRLDQPQLKEIAHILTYLSEVDGNYVVVHDAAIGLESRDGVYLGYAVWNKDAEIWQFEAAEAE